MLLLSHFQIVFFSQIRELRHLFNDDTMFVALQSHEKFPEEGFDVDVQSELPCTLIFFLNVLNLIIQSDVSVLVKAVVEI